MTKHGKHILSIFSKRKVRTYSIYCTEKEWNQFISSEKEFTDKEETPRPLNKCCAFLKTTESASGVAAPRLFLGNSSLGRPPDLAEEVSG